MSERANYRVPGSAIPSVMAMAASDPRFAEALLGQREGTLDACGFPLSPEERRTLLHANPVLVRRMIAEVASRLHDADRRRFLELAGLAVATLIGHSAAGAGGWSGPASPLPDGPDLGVTPSCPCLGSPDPGWGTGIRPSKGPYVVPVRHSVKGGLDRDTVRRVVRRHLQELEACYRKAHSATPGLEGLLVTRFVIDALGNVIQSDAARDTLRNAELTRCVLAAIRTWKFPKPDEPGKTTSVEYTFEFKIRR